jgi:hypothetical protein
MPLPLRRRVSSITLQCSDETLGYLGEDRDGHHCVRPESRDRQSDIRATTSILRGFQFVLINGVPVVRDGHLVERVYPGRAARAQFPSVGFRSAFGGDGGAGGRSGAYSQCELILLTSYLGGAMTRAPA